MANEKIGLIGRKLGMTQLFKSDGSVVGVTVLETGPCTVLQVKTEDTRDAYNAIQLAYGSKKSKLTTSAQRGHLKKAGLESARFVREMRLSKADASKYEVGQSLVVDDVFTKGARVDVTSISKGRGFAGVMKRHNFKGAIRTHGTHEFFRHGGSIGTRLTPGFVMKRTKMPGHMGSKRVTVQNLTVESIDTERNLLYVRGGVPGANGTVVTVRRAAKAGR